MIKLEVKLHNSEDGEVLEVEEYDAQETSDVINGVTKNDDNNKLNVIVLADNIYSCIDIKSIKVIK